MEGRGDGQNHRALGAGLLRDLHGALHRGGVPGNHRLVRRIQICRRADLAVGGALARVGYHRRRKAHNRGHGALAGRHSFLHILAALADQPHRVGKLQRAHGDQRRIFAQTVAGNKIRLYAFFSENPMHGDGASKNRGLRVGGLLEIFLRAGKAHLRNRKAQGLVRFVKNGARGGIFFGKFFAHARVLRRLPWKHKSNFSHLRSLFLVSLCRRHFRYLTIARAEARANYYAVTPAKESSSSIFSLMRALASPAATRMAFFIALALERPWAITQTPRTPSSGAPPDSA